MFTRTLVAATLLLAMLPAAADGWFGPAKIRDISAIDGFSAVRFSKVPAGCQGNGWFGTTDAEWIKPHVLAAYVKGVDVWYAPSDCTKPHMGIWAISTARPTSAARPRDSHQKILDSIERDAKE